MTYGLPQNLPPPGFLGMGNGTVGLSNNPMPAMPGMPQAPQPQQPMPQIDTNTPSPFGHIGDVLNQYVASKQQQAQPGLIQQILTERFQPTEADTALAGLREQQSYASKGGFQAYTPEMMAQQRVGNELAPYTTSLGLQGQQADVTLKQAQANQANALSQFFTGGSGGGAATSGVAGQPGQPTFNPRGAMMAKMLGLPEGMQIGSGGQPEQIPGVVTPGQKEQDTNFAQAWQIYSNTGGAARTQNAIGVVDDVINQLKAGKFRTGADDLGSRMAWDVNKNEPSQYGVIMNPTMLSARNRVASAILPQAKALFGSRVTNFDAQTVVNSKGVDPISDTATNIQKLEQLKSELISGQRDLLSSGQYFQQHGTLAGYQPQILQQQPQGSVPQPIMQGVANSPAGKAMGASVNPPTAFDPTATVQAGGATHRYNPQTGQLEAIQ